MRSKVLSRIAFPLCLILAVMVVDAPIWFLGLLTGVFAGILIAVATDDFV